MVSAHAWLPAAVALCSMHVAPKAVNAWLHKPDVEQPKAGVTGARSQDYARARRIVKTDEFSSVFRLRPVQRTGHFVLYIRENQLAHARLGVVAAKRFAPRAVTRNTIKRVSREFFRQALLPGIDCIVRLSKPVNTKAGPATSAALKAELRRELHKLFHAVRLDRELP